MSYFEFWRLLLFRVYTRTSNVSPRKFGLSDSSGDVTTVVWPPHNEIIINEGSLVTVRDAGPNQLQGVHTLDLSAVSKSK